MINHSNYYKNFDAKKESNKTFAGIIKLIKYAYNELKKAEELCSNIPINETGLQEIIKNEEKGKITGSF